MPADLTLLRVVAFSETDLAGVMHFSNYYRWMEDAEHAVWRSLGRSVHAPDGDSVLTWPRVATRCEYYIPLRFEDEIELAIRVARSTDKTLTWGIEFRRAGQRCAAGELTAVCCRIEQSRFAPTPIPIEIRKLLGI